jgi:hypothetical protein
MVKILHVYLKRSINSCHYVFSAEKKLVIFSNGSKVKKKNSREGSSNLTADANQHF